MHHRLIHTERCYYCREQNQVVYNRHEVLTCFGIRRVCICDECHRIHMHDPIPTKGESISIGGTKLRATNANLQRLLQVLGG